MKALLYSEELIEDKSKYLKPIEDYLAVFGFELDELVVVDTEVETLTKEEVLEDFTIIFVIGDKFFDIKKTDKISGLEGLLSIKSVEKEIIIEQFINIDYELEYILKYFKELIDKESDSDENRVRVKNISLIINTIKKIL